MYHYNFSRRRYHIYHTLSHDLSASTYCVVYILYIYVPGFLLYLCGVTRVYLVSSYVSICIFVLVLYMWQCSIVTTYPVKFSLCLHLQSSAMYSSVLMYLFYIILVFLLYKDILLPFPFDYDIINCFQVVCLLWKEVSYVWQCLSYSVSFIIIIYYTFILFIRELTDCLLWILDQTLIQSICITSLYDIFVWNGSVLRALYIFVRWLWSIIFLL
jgi:hypothetical protein